MFFYIDMFDYGVRKASFACARLIPVAGSSRGRRRLPIDPHDSQCSFNGDNMKSWLAPFILEEILSTYRWAHNDVSYKHRA